MCGDDARADEAPDREGRHDAATGTRRDAWCRHAEVGEALFWHSAPGASDSGRCWRPEPPGSETDDADLRGGSLAAETVAGALPPPGRVRPGPGREVTPPRTPTEQALAAIWADVLGVEDVTRDDDFFDLGGHSLLAVQLFARIESALGVRLPLAELFRDDSVTFLAWEQRKKIGSRATLALWLHAYFTSHRDPLPITIQKNRSALAPMASSRS